MAPRKAGTSRPKKTEITELPSISITNVVAREIEKTLDFYIPINRTDIIETTGIELHNVLKRTIEGLQRPDKQTYEPTVYEIGANPKEEIRLLGFKVVLDETIEPGTAELVGPNGKVVVKWA